MRGPSGGLGADSQSGPSSSSSALALVSSGGSRDRGQDWYGHSASHDGAGGSLSGTPTHARFADAALGKSGGGGRDGFGSRSGQ